MAVYDREMFRRPRPTAQGAGDVAAKALMGEVENRMVNETKSGIASAQNYEQVMNAMRGDEQSVKERRQELGGIVGMKDANKTPESVLTLVQPVIQMREAQGAVDQGIGQVAQKAMDTPVEGAMAGGIMQPLKLQPGGAVSLKRLYEQNLPVIQDIYGDQSEELRKQALGQFLLGGAAPVGLAIAQGTPVAEALMQLGPYAAQLGAGVQKQKSATQAAQKQAALQMAQSELAAQREAAAKAKELKFPSPGSSIVDAKGNILGTVPEKTPAAGATAMYKYTGKEPLTIEGYGTIQPGATLPIGANELRTFGPARQLLQEIKEPTKPQAAGEQTLYTNTSDVTIQTPGGPVLPGEEISLGSNELAKVTNRTALKPVKEDTSALTKDMVFKGPTVYEGVTYKAGDIVPPMSTRAFNRLQEQNPALISKMASLNAFDRDKLPSPEILFSVDENNNRVQKAVFTQGELSVALAEGFSTEDDSTYVPQPMVKLLPSGKQISATPKTLAKAKELSALGYVTFDPSMMRTVGNKLLSVFPTGTVVNFSSMDPIPLFNKKGEKRVITSEEELLKAYNAPDPFYLKEPPSKDVTKKSAYGELPTLTTKLERWADDTPGVEWTDQDQKEFDTYLSAVQSATIIGPSAANPNSYEVQRPVVPNYIISAVAKAKAKDPNFPSYGLLPKTEETPLELANRLSQTPDLIRDINYADNIGFGSWFARNADRIAGVVVESFGGRYRPKFPEAAEATATMNALMVQSRTAALADLTGKQTEGIRKEINDLLFDPAGPGLTAQSARVASESMVDVLEQAIETKQTEWASTNPTNTARRDALTASIVNLTKLKANWKFLADSLAYKKYRDPNDM